MKLIDLKNGDSWSLIPRAINALNEAVRQLLDGKPGPGLARTAGGVMYVVGQQPESRIQSPCHFFAVITGSTAIIAGVKWSYTFEEIVKTGDAGYSGAWSIRTGGRTGTAYNILEYINTADGLCGNGIDAQNLTDNFPGFALQPVPTGTPVIVFISKSAVGTEYWIQIPNGIDGSCE